MLVTEHLESVATSQARPGTIGVVGEPNAPRRRGRLLRIVIVAVLVLLAMEGVVRLRADALPPPLKWATLDLDRKETQIGELRKDGGASLVFVGSSTVDAGVDPSALGPLPGRRPAYNAGLRGGTIRMVSSWTRLVAVPRLRPNVVVIGVASRELNRNNELQRGREEAYFDAPAVRHLIGTETVLQQTERRLEGASAVFKYRTWIRDPRYVRAFLGLSEAPTVTQTAVGDYLAPDGQFRFFLRRPYNAATFNREHPAGVGVDPSQQSELRELLAFLGPRVDRVIVLNMPVSPDYVADQSDAHRTAFARVLREEARRIDAGYVEAGVWPTGFFADPVHVNQRGSTRLTTLVERALRTGNR
jgi:hypothetical protein